VPFLDDFYLNPTEFAYETETSFTLLHYYQLKKLGCDFAVADFSLIDDYAFALTTLTASEFAIYEKMFEYIIERIGRPNKIIYLEAPIDILLKRIAKRGRNSEKSIASDYLTLVDKNIRITIEKKFCNVPLVAVSTEMTKSTAYDKRFIDSLISL
jgi:deoxyguanosine kinase